MLFRSLGACDYVLCRKDGSYYDGRRPDSVEVGSIYDDLKRRDFTVNAIAVTEEGEIIDPHNGVEDLKARYLRCVGKAEERFTEDGLRILRALRFSLTKELKIDYDILPFLDEYDLFEPRMRGVSTERVYEELLKCFRFDTDKTLTLLLRFDDLRYWLFKEGKIWLKPTLEER